MCRFVIVLSLFLTVANAIAQEENLEIDVEIKRPSLWVPSLDRAIVFYRDVLGFKVEAVGYLELDQNSVLYDLFKLDRSVKVKRALFSSVSNKRTLFVMQADGAPEYKLGDKRHSTQVIKTNDIKLVKARAKKYGFDIGASNAKKNDSGKTLTELVIVGPGGQATLVYQYD